MNAEMITCPHCGKENLPQATRCVHCGEDLDEVFKIEGVENIPLPSEGPDVSVSELLQAFRQPDKPAEDKPLTAGAPFLAAYRLKKTLNRTSLLKTKIRLRSG